jgi:hypothetical protein
LSVSVVLQISGRLTTPPTNTYLLRKFEALIRLFPIVDIFLKSDPRVRSWDRLPKVAAAQKITRL